MTTPEREIETKLKLILKNKDVEIFHCSINTLSQKVVSGYKLHFLDDNYCMIITVNDKS